MLFKLPMRKILYRLGFTFLIGLPLLGLIYQLPPVKVRLAWRVDELQAKIKYALAPPEQAIFVPQQQGEKNELPLPQVSTSTPVPSPALVPVRRTAVFQPTLTPTVTATPLPDQVHLSGIRHGSQGWNNCGPATLAMALSFWGWQGDQYFAWFNRGTNLVASQDYASAAEAFDQAFAIYPTIPEEQRPWRMMWYQTGPYWAYFYTGRYQDVVDLASSTLDNMSEPVLEESYYWRALAREAMGDLDGAIKDLQASLDVHPGFEPGLSQLERLGAME